MDQEAGKQQDVRTPRQCRDLQLSREKKVRQQRCINRSPKILAQLTFFDFSEVDLNKQAVRPSSIDDSKCLPIINPHRKGVLLSCRKGQCKYFFIATTIDLVDAFVGLNHI